MTAGIQNLSAERAKRAYAKTLENITILKQECEWAGFEPPEFITQMYDALTDLMDSMEGPEPNFARGIFLVHMIDHLSTTNDIPAVMQEINRKIANQRF